MIQCVGFIVVLNLLFTGKLGSKMCYCDIWFVKNIKLIFKCFKCLFLRIICINYSENEIVFRNLNKGTNCNILWKKFIADDIFKFKFNYVEKDSLKYVKMQYINGVLNEIFWDSRFPFTFYKEMPLFKEECGHWRVHIRIVMMCWSRGEALKVFICKPGIQARLAGCCSIRRDLSTTAT